MAGDIVYWNASYSPVLPTHHSSPFSYADVMNTEGNGGQPLEATWLPICLFGPTSAILLTYI